MAKKLLSLLKCPPTQNISIQVTDPDNICGCIKQLHQNTELLKDIYDAYSGTVKFGENKLRETDDTLSKMGVMLTNFDPSLTRWGRHMQTDAEQLREKEQRLERLKKEVEFDRNWLVEKREQFPMKLQDDDYQKAMRIQKIRDYREERGLIETKMKKADEQIEKVLENIEDAEEKYENIQKARWDHKRAHKSDIQNLMAEWEESRGKRDLLQSLDVHPKTLLSSLGDKGDWRAKDKELSDLRKEHDILRENVQDQQDRKDIIRLRNDELRRRIIQNEAILHNLREDAKEEYWSKDGTSHKHDDRHESHRHGRGGTSHRHHDKDGSSHKHGTSHKHHDHGTSHRHHAHGKSHKDHEPSTSHRYGNRDGSPPRHGSRDGSPPRHHSHKDGTSHRHDSAASHRHRSRDLSPPRHGSRDGSPPRHEKRDASPPNRHAHRDGSHGARDESYGHKEGYHRSRDGSHGNRDVSPPRHGNRETSHRSREGSHGHREVSPPRHQEYYETTRRGSRVLSSNTRNRDSSPPRHVNRDVSPPRQGSKDHTRNRDSSPPRHMSRDVSPPRHGSKDHTRNRDSSPPRHVSRDVSPPRQGSKDPPQGYRDRSPPRQDNRNVSLGNRDESPALRQDSPKDGTTQRRGSSVASPKLGTRDGTSSTGIGREAISEDRDVNYLPEQVPLSQFGSQTVVGHQSSDEDFTQL